MPAASGSDACGGSTTGGVPALAAASGAGSLTGTDSVIDAGTTVSDLLAERLKVLLGGSVSFSTIIGAVRWVDACEIFASISWRIRASRIALEVPPSTTQTSCRLLRRTDAIRL